MTYISVSMSISDVARETNTQEITSELLNEWGRLENGNPKIPVFDICELDAYGATMIDAMHKQLSEARAKGWTP